MKPEHNKKDKEINSVENNLSSEYIPKKKLGDLPIENELALSEEVKKEMEKTRKEIEKVEEELKKKFKFVEGLGILPVQVSTKIEEEYEIPLEDCKKKLIHILVLIPEDNFKELNQVKSEAVQIGKKINDKFWFHVLTPVDLWNLGLDSKFDILESFSMSFPIFDKGILGALRVAQIHKTLVLKKFERYVTSYVLWGSLSRGEAKKESDVDVAIIIDDTDVKRMPRLELKEKLRSIIYQYISEATAIAGVKNVLNVQVYLMTDFWESVKDAHPVIFTLIRDGIPLYDRGTFLPWKLLLRMGKIKPSPEAIDLFMASGDKLEESINRRLLDIVVYDIYWGVLTPSQALLMLYGLAPPTPKETIKLMREVLVEKEKILEDKYIKILEKIVHFYKAYEREEIKKVSGKEIDEFLKDTMDYMKRLKELREQIDRRVQEKSIEQVYKDVFGMLGSMLKKKSEKEIFHAFEEQLIKTGRFPLRFIEQLKFISKVKEEFEKKDKKDEKISQKESRDVEQARKFSAEIVNTLVEYNQRCDFMAIDRSKFNLKSRGKNVELFFLDDTFAVEGSKIHIISDGKLKESNSEELRRQLAGHQHKETKISEKVMQELKKVYGEFELVY
jgi:predicted nucleotidyltransferase/uncharacterized protein (UPF0332 family)